MRARLTLVLAVVIPWCLFALAGRADAAVEEFGTGVSTSAFATSGFQSPLTETASCATQGGRLAVLSESEFETLDPGSAYDELDYSVIYATQRPLYSYQPGTETEAVPDLAEGQPEISDLGRTVTVHIKHGIRFSPPVNREVTAEDVAYAIERGAGPEVANPYFHAYFEAIEGAPGASGGPIKGIQTPNSHEIVFHLTAPQAELLREALVLPLTAPVPEEYAKPFDKHAPSTYADYEVSTGPYMLDNDSTGRVLGIGDQLGRSVTLVRNPNWVPITDYRPACVDEIEIEIGEFDPFGRAVLEGIHVVLDEPATTLSTLEAATHDREQLEISPGAGDHYISLNNRVGPFTNVDLRKAVWAALDRQAMNRARGGPLLSTVASHFIYPGIPGFEQAGGLRGPAVDYDEHPSGDMKLARHYLRLAGFRHGRYTGERPVTIVSPDGYPAARDAEIVNTTLKRLGFRTKLSLRESAVAYSSYCDVPKREVTICPAVGWVADFGDPQSVLDVAFNGRHIPPVDNTNWSQTDIPAINSAMAAAEDLSGSEARAQAWAAIDDELVRDAVAIPVEWNKGAFIEGKGVAGVGDLWNGGEWDYSFMSLR